MPRGARTPGNREPQPFDSPAVEQARSVACRLTALQRLTVAGHEPCQRRRQRRPRLRDLPGSRAVLAARVAADPRFRRLDRVRGDPRTGIDAPCLRPGALRRLECLDRHRVPDPMNRPQQTPLAVEPDLRRALDRRLRARPQIDHRRARNLGGLHDVDHLPRADRRQCPVDQPTTTAPRGDERNRHRDRQNGRDSHEAHRQTTRPAHRPRPLRRGDCVRDREQVGPLG